jgi:hypothetical protein
MKAITSLIFVTVLIMGLAGTKVCSGQTVAIGHVSAEVIESVSASTQAVTDLSIGTTGTVDLGAMTVNSGSNVTVNVVVKSATLSDSQGNGFTLDPAVTNSNPTAVAQENGSQTIRLNGTANLADDQASGLYQGSYTVVFAYN